MCRFLLLDIPILFMAACAQASHGPLVSGEGITFVSGSTLIVWKGNHRLPNAKRRSPRSY